MNIVRPDPAAVPPSLSLSVLKESIFQTYSAIFSPSPKAGIEVPLFSFLSPDSPALFLPSSHRALNYSRFFLFFSFFIIPKACPHSGGNLWRCQRVRPFPCPSPASFLPISVYYYHFHHNACVQVDSLFLGVNRISVFILELSFLLLLLTLPNLLPRSFYPLLIIIFSFYKVIFIFIT